MTVAAPVATPIALTVAEQASQVDPLAVTADPAALIERQLNDHAAVDVWLTDTDAPPGWVRGCGIAASGSVSRSPSPTCTPRSTN